MELLQKYQLDLMLALCGIGVALAVLVLLSKALSRRRRLVIAIIELSSAFLLFFDRLAYLYDGNAGSRAIAIAHVSNFCVYVLTHFVIFAFIHYIMNIIREDLKKKISGWLWVACALSFAGILFVVVGSCTEYIYYIDRSGVYHRGTGFLFCYIIPGITTLMLVWFVFRYHDQFSRTIRISLLLFLLGPVAASVIQFFLYGLSILNITISIMSILAYVFAYLDINDKVDRANSIKIEHLEEQRKLSQRLFEQIATVLANAIDAKDEYTRGHSRRVAEYSEKIAREMGKNDDECKKVYYTALLHDVGKIGIADSIITKNGRLTDEEYEAIKQHSVIGNQILSSIKDYPFLAVGAHHHHERYDGKGYPDHLKGEDIPEIARIISVADAYDAMTSNRSYRAAIPQQIVREEIVKNAGTQFDPNMAKIMQYLIDLDNRYLMKERETMKELGGDDEIRCEEYGSEVSEGILLSAQAVRIRFTYEPAAGHFTGNYPGIILFDSLDANVHTTPNAVRDMLYLEYGKIRLDGEVVTGAARKIEVRRDGSKPSGGIAQNGDSQAQIYEIEAVRVKDHARIILRNAKESIEVIVALPDSTRFAYIGLTGQYCTIYDVTIEHAETGTPADSIPRIAEEISYIASNEGDIPNVQIDNFRSAATCGIEITDGMKLTFHSMSLPTARLIWHCPYIVLFYSDNGEVQGGNYHEYGLVRLDGEYWEGTGVRNTSEVRKRDDFKGWEEWKNFNKAGIDVAVSFVRKANMVTVTTENFGIFIENTTEIIEGEDKVYVALSGDQCALTNIRIVNR